MTTTFRALGLAASLLMGSALAANADVPVTGSANPSTQAPNGGNAVGATGMNSGTSGYVRVNPGYVTGQNSVTAQPSGSGPVSGPETNNTSAGGGGNGGTGH